MVSLLSHIHCRATAVLNQKKEVSVCERVCLCVCFAAGLSVQDDESQRVLLTFSGVHLATTQLFINMQGFYSKLDSSPLLGVALGREGTPVPLSLAVETEKAQALLQTFSSASLLASAGLGLFCVAADHGLQLPLIQHHLWLRAALDNGTHAVVGLWSWAVVIGLRKKSDVYEVLLAGLLASIIDLDHFYMAGSLSIKAAASLPQRPPLHCSSLIPVLCLSLRFLMWLGRLKDAWCSLPWMLFISMATHHVRDAVRRGLWVCPLGNTAPLPYWLYVSTTATLPHLCSVLMYLTGTRDVISTKHGVAIDV